VDDQLAEILSIVRPSGDSGSRSGFQQCQALDVMGHRKEADGTERERDPLPKIAFIGGNWAL